MGLRISWPLPELTKEEVDLQTPYDSTRAQPSGNTNAPNNT